MANSETCETMQKNVTTSTMQKIVTTSGNLYQAGCNAKLWSQSLGMSPAQCLAQVAMELTNTTLGRQHFVVIFL